MKILDAKITNHFFFLLLLLPFISCKTVRNVHNDAVDIGFLKNKGEGNAGLGFDINTKTAAVNGNFMISPADNFLLGAGFSAFSYKIFDDNSEADNNIIVEDVGKLKGYKARANIGYYSNFGESGNGYFETMVTGSYGSNELLVSDDDDPNNAPVQYNYDPFSFAIQGGIGRNSERIGLMGGLKFQRYLFGKQIPAYQNYDEDVISVDGVSVFQLFYGMRFGSGPVRGNFQINLSINPNDYDDSLVEPYPSLSFGVTYAFGRK